MTHETGKQTAALLDSCIKVKGHDFIRFFNITNDLVIVL